jgi:hypothetical protein
MEFFWMVLCVEESALATACYDGTVRLWSAEDGDD